MTTTIIIPTYNYAQFLPRAIHSVYAQQEVPTPQVLVMDDGSTDDTAIIIAQLQQQYPGLAYHPQPSAGKAAATARGIALATGQVIFTLDADDWFSPGKIAATLAILQQYPQVVHVATPALIHWQQAPGRTQPEPIPCAWLQHPQDGSSRLRQLYTANKLYGGGSTFAARAEVLKNIPLPSAVDMYTDEWLIIQTLLQGQTYLLPTPGSAWCIHGGNYSQPHPAKIARLQASSLAMLQGLAQTQAPPWLQKIYRLKHQVRQQVWARQAGTQTLASRWQFFWQVILTGGYPPPLLHRYRAFNRLIK